MNQIYEFYVRYFTIVIFIMGFILGIIHIFGTLGSYQTISEYAYNDICVNEFGKYYTFYEYDVKTNIITCEKETSNTFSIKKQVELSGRFKE